MCTQQETYLYICFETNQSLLTPSDWHAEVVFSMLYSSDTDRTPQTCKKHNHLHWQEAVQLWTLYIQITRLL